VVQWGLLRFFSTLISDLLANIFLPLLLWNRPFCKRVLY
jgi:hypothetical protein